GPEGGECVARSSRPEPPRVGIFSWQKLRTLRWPLTNGVDWSRPLKRCPAWRMSTAILAGKPRLIYVKAPAPNREDGLKALLAGIQADDTASYKTFATTEELQELLESDLALLLTEHFEISAATGTIDKARPELRLSSPPLPLTSILGRDADIELIGRLLAGGARLVTVTGTGGIGKSRLVVEVTRRFARELPGVHFVPLDRGEACHSD